MWRPCSAVAVLAIALTACAGGAHSSAVQRSSTTRAPAVSETTIPPTSTQPPTTTAVRTADAIGSSIVPATCPVEVAPQSGEDLSAQPQPVTRVLLVHEYPIEGASGAELRSSMDRCRPNVSGSDFDGYTAWFVNWKFSSVNSNGCSIQSVKVHVRVDMYLPQWLNPSGPPLVDTWNRYLAALNAHEAGHEQHGIDAADRVYQTLSALPPSSTCTEAIQAANQAGHDVVDTFAHEDATYDDQTSHGASQGAVFP